MRSTRRGKGMEVPTTLGLVGRGTVQALSRKFRAGWSLDQPNRGHEGTGDPERKVPRLGFGSGDDE